MIVIDVGFNRQIVEGITAGSVKQRAGRGWASPAGA
jgi:hypothetical protein